MVCVRGHFRELIYDEAGYEVVEVVDLVARGDFCGYTIPRGVWHSLEVMESGTVILECKDGEWRPLGEVKR